MDWNNRAYRIAPFKEGSHLSGLEFMRQVSASTHNQANITLTPSAQDYFHAS